MITLPLVNKLDVRTSANYSLNIDTYKVVQGTNNSLGISPNMLNEAISLMYPSLAYTAVTIDAILYDNECKYVEDILKSTNGTTRILYNNLRYLLKDSYNVEYGNNYAKISLTLTQVA